MINIDKGIPMPDAKTGNQLHSKYPWQIMEIGDSFLIEDRSQQSVSPMASTAGKKYGRKFNTRVEGNGVRVWRVE